MQAFPHFTMYGRRAWTGGPWCRVLCRLLWLALLALPARADIYIFEDGNGNTHYSDRATDHRYRLLLAVRDSAPLAATDTAHVFGSTNKSRNSRNPSRFDRQSFAQEIATAARATQIDEALLHAVIAVESNYNPRAVSPKGALGLMQLMPATARQYGIQNPLDAAENIQGGARHLRQLLDYFSDNVTLALAAYNAGLGAVVRHGGRIPPFAETRTYVPKVLQHYATNQQLHPVAPGP